MSQLNGKWKRTKAENVEAFLKEIAGVDAEKLEKFNTYLTKAQVVDDVEVTSDGWRRRTYVNDELKADVGGKFNEETERQTILGKSKILAKKVSDSRIEVTETGLDHPSSTFAFYIKDGKMVIEQTLNGVTCTRYSEKC